MPRETLKLPKNKKELARVVDSHVDREESRLSYRRTMWLLAWHYLNGARRFDLFDPDSGTIRPHYLDEEGNMEFQSQELLSAIDRVSSRIASLDLRPKVLRQGLSLAGIRERSISQIILDSVVSSDHLDSVKTKFSHIFTTLGSCGIAGHVIDHPTIGLTTDLEVIHPRELFPFPSLGQDYTKVQGLVRQRVVPLSFLKETFGAKIVKNLKEMEYWEQVIGEELEEENDGGGGDSSTYWTDRGTGGAASETTELVGVAKIREIWTYGVGNTVDRYAVTSGDYTIHDQSFEGLETYCPIGFARFLENGTFHGAGLFDLLFSISREFERLMKSLFNNIRDLDKYGVVVMPQGQYNERAMLRDVGRGLRVLPFEPDPVSENFRPFTINPHNLGDVPGKTAAFAKQMMDTINPVRDLIQEKGRIDSAAGLSFLDEQINKAMTNPTRAVENIFGSAYRSILSNATRYLVESPRALPLEKLSLDLAGVIIDPEKDVVQFNDNPVPSVNRLIITVKETSPRSAIARKMEALEMLKAGLTDPDSFKLFAVKEGLDFAMYLDEERAAYESVVRNCLTLYGDGDSPGQIVLTPQTAKPEFQARVLSSFMANPVMSLASPEVQNEFSKYREFLLESLGLTLPEAVPNPDDLAMLMQAGAVEQPGLPPGVGGPPGQMPGGPPPGSQGPMPMPMPMGPPR